MLKKCVATAILLITVPAFAGPWYSGGNLSITDGKGWRKAPYERRLATAGEILSKAAAEGRLLNPYVYIDEIKPTAERLETAISAQAKTTRGAGRQVSELGEACLQKLGLLKKSPVPHPDVPNASD